MHVQRQRRLARAFRAINFNDAALGQAANAERDVERQRAGGDRFDLDHRLLAQAHDRAFAEGLVDLLQSGCQGLLLVRFHCLPQQASAWPSSPPSVWPESSSKAIGQPMRRRGIICTAFVLRTQAEHLGWNVPTKLARLARSFALRNFEGETERIAAWPRRSRHCRLRGRHPATLEGVTSFRVKTAALSRPAGPIQKPDPDMVLVTAPTAASSSIRRARSS